MKISGKIAGALALAIVASGCSQEKAPSGRSEKPEQPVVEAPESSAAPVSLVQGKYAPRDECQDVPGADAFRKQLAEAIAARDADRLAALASPEVQLDFGGGSGLAELRSRLNDRDIDLWGELADLVKLGCALDDEGGITIPWDAAQEIDVQDPYMSMIVTGEEVPLRERADTKSPPLENVSWDIVTLVAGFQPEDPLQHVRSADGTEGYIATGDLRSLTDYRLSASRRDGKWKFTSLVAGD